jgi:NTP pyrophosphatase (non-canonical NTP hydrolase)
MTFDQYDRLTNTTCKDSIRGNTSYFALGLNGEAGEVGELFKKAMRDGHKVNRGEAMKELGDVLWYVSQLAQAVGSSLEEVADWNISKLQDRKIRDVIGGSGDDR